jgi:hypothetical protein
MLTFASIGLPRVFSLFGESTNHTSDAVKESVALIVLLLHAPFVLAFLAAIIFPPRKAAFNTQGIAGGVVSASIVISLFSFHSASRSVTYKVPLCFTDLQDRPIDNLSVTVVWKIEGLTQTTSKTKQMSVTAPNGALDLEKTKDEELIVTAHKDGFTYARVDINPMHAPYPKGPLQKIDMSWTIELGQGDRTTSAFGSKNWSFANGTLRVPVPPSTRPVSLPIKPYTESDLKEVMPGPNHAMQPLTGRERAGAFDALTGPSLSLGSLASLRATCNRRQWQPHSH